MLDNHSRPELPGPSDSDAPLDDSDLPSVTNELLRKGLHLVVATLPLAMLEIGKMWSLAILVPVTALAVCAELVRSRHAGFERFIRRVFGAMMRPAEYAVDRKLIINGATWVMISLTLLTILFPLIVVAAAFVMFMIGDAAAALVGKSWGRHTWSWSDRTFEGSLAFVIVALGVGMFFKAFAWPSLVATTTVGAMIESLPGPFNDNIRVPVCMAIALVVSQALT